MRPFAWLFVFLATALPLLAAENERVWTNTQGRTMRAQFLREVDGEAVFLNGGKPFTIPLDQLSEPDRQYIRELASAKQPEGEDAAGVNPFQPVIRPGDPAQPGPRAGDRVPALEKKMTDIVNREWIDLAGNRTSGKFVRVYDRTVLIMRGLRTVDLSFDTLSFEDQSYVNKILIERGERPLSPLPLVPGAPPLGPPFPPDSEGPAAGPAAQPSNSQFFEELRRRQEETRQEQARHAAETPPDVSGQLPPERTHQPPLAAESPAAAADSVTGDAAAPTTPVPSPGLVIDAKTLAELRPVLIIGLVVIGLFATIGVIVFIATSIAASNSNRRQRRYS
jgi:hypothetical protein